MSAQWQENRYRRIIILKRRDDGVNALIVKTKQPPAETQAVVFLMVRFCQRITATNVSDISAPTPI